LGEQQPLDLGKNLEHDKLEEQERVEILEEIDKVVETNRLPVSEDMEKLKPQKSGIVFPLLINLFAVTAVLATFYFSNRLFEQKQEVLSLQNASYQSAEGKLLEELKRESEEKLKEKDDEIGAIQDELVELDRQSRELAESMDQQIQDREAALRLALEEELEIERRKLQGQGRTEADIEEELRKLEQQRTAEYDAELAAFKNETEAAIAEKEEELSRAKQLNQELLAEVNSEKQRIENETRKRETELTAQYESEKAALAEEAAAAEAQLEQLTKNQAQESLIVDQINGSYDSIFDLIDKGSHDEALSAISSLKDLIENPSIATLNAVKKRKATDQNMLDMLKEKIEEQTYKESTDSRSLAAAADLLLSASEISQLGAASYAAGNEAEAEEYYTRALQKIPALKTAWEDLQAISTSTEKNRMTALLDSAAGLAEAGDIAGAAEQFAAAATSAETGNAELLSRAVSGLADSSETRRETQIAEKDAELSKIETEGKAEIDRLAAELSEAEKEYEETLSSINTGHEDEIVKIIADYENLMGDASGEYSSLQTEMNDEIDRLTRMIGERDQENLRINTEREEKTAALEAADTNIVELQSSIEESKLRYQELSQTLRDEQQSIDERLTQESETSYTRGFNKGRNEAFEDVLYFASLLDGTAAYDPEAASKISELAENEAIYEQAVQKIQQIASKGSSASGSEIIPVEQDILIGSVSYASGTKIVIEMLTDLELVTGTRIKIKRKERGKEEYYITFGIITSISDNRIEARTDPAGEVSAQSLDLVYVTNSQ